jgi:hypothetical protein
MAFSCTNGILRHYSAFFELNAHFCIMTHPKAYVATPREKIEKNLYELFRLPRRRQRGLPS